VVESSLVGRHQELSRLAAAIEEVAEGRGFVCFLTGEAGIGKSRLAEEAARLARDRGMRIYWGRCWEAGGAPAYWPWVQVLRAILRTAEPDQVDPFLAPLGQMLPELRRTQAIPEATELGPEQARFQVMDAVGHLLAETSERCPMVIVLEDLHVADISTVLLLDFLAAIVRNHAILIIGTYREAELGAAAAGPQLLRAAQQGHRLALDRLTHEEVAAFLETTGETVDPDFVGALHRITEGHPLFLVEVARLWRMQGARDHTGRPAIPKSVRQAIQERLQGLSPECALSLRRGAVIGREFDTILLEASYPNDSSDTVEACQEATDHALLIEVAPLRYRFSHFLIRELVYESIPDAERGDAHRRLAEVLLERPDNEGQPRWSEIAHHFTAAGPGTASKASEAYRQASAQALRQLAFDEAVIAAHRALDACERALPVDERVRIAILIQLGHAQTRAGDIQAGKTTCAKAAALARDLGDASLLAKAALEHGSALIFANVDAELVALLEEALELLESSDSPLRARLMARLAAALQPALDPEPPMELARQAIAMARRTGDKQTLLDTLRDGGSAMVDLGDVEERLLLDREHAALAEELGNPIEGLRANMRSFMVFVQLGRLDDAFRTLHACERAADELDHPTYRWRCQALRVLRALWEGDFDEADRYLEEVRALVEQAGDPNARLTYAYQKARILLYRGEFDAQLPFVDELEESWRGTALGGATAGVLVGAEHLMSGRREAALRRFDAEAVAKLLHLGDPSSDLCAARLCAAAEHRELAERLYKKLLLSKESLFTTGMIGMTIEGPGSWPLALLAKCLGREEDARAHYEDAIATTRRTNGHPVNTLLACEYAEMLATSTAPADRQRALELAQSAAVVAAQLGMRDAEKRAHAVTSQLEGASEITGVSLAPSPRVDMNRVGDSWLIQYGGAEFHLRDMKGVRLLAHLVDNPGREYHVLDLSGETRTSEHRVDRGDAGRVIDEEARQQYQARVAALREELEEAESWNDAGRTERARGELEFLRRELAKAVGLGGRERRVGAAAERARINVQRRIRDAIRRVEAHHPDLAKHLDRAVKTGTYCSYNP